MSATVRVAPKEIRDVAFRVLRVAGVCPAEASLAARGVLAAHLLPSAGGSVPGAGADGLTMLFDELPRTTSERAGARFRDEAVPVLVDEARRGLFFAVPAGVERLLADPSVTSVLLPGVSWRPGADALVAVVAGEQAAALVLEDVEQPDGPALLLRRRQPGGAPPPIAVGSLESCGLEVDAEQWRAAHAAARPYLVPEP